MTTSYSGRFYAKAKTFILLGSIGLLMGGCASGEPRYSQQSKTPSAQPTDISGYVLGAGDVLRVIVFGDEQLSGEFTIDASGHISMPLVQEVAAAGHTARDLEKTITDKLQPEYLNDPKVSVQVIEYRSVYILGEVRLPGKYPYVPNMTLLQAVAVAGGHTYRAEEDGAEISRQTAGTVKKFNVGPDAMIMPGDTVVINRRWF